MKIRDLLASGATVVDPGAGVVGFFVGIIIGQHPDAKWNCQK